MVCSCDGIDRIESHLGVESSHDTETGNLFAFVKAYEHQLARAAYNMVCGKFGGVQNRDCLCVQVCFCVRTLQNTLHLQSLDGVLSIYEQDVFTFSRFLPGSLLPGPLAYVSGLDAFITTSSNWHLHCYK